MKKSFVKYCPALLLAFFVMFACMPKLSAQAANFRNFKVGDTLVVAAQPGVNMHVMPSTSTSVISVVGYGQHLCILQIDQTTGWMRIIWRGHIGYMRGDEGFFVKYDNSQITETPLVNKQAIVNASALNVHSTPRELSTNIIDALLHGQVVDAIAQESDGMYKVSYYRGNAKIIGYVDSAWVTLQTPAKPEPVESFTNIYGYSAQVNSSVEALNVHRSPSVSATVIGDLYGGQVVTILAKSTNWYKVTLNLNDEMVTGYILRSYTKKIDALKNIRLNATKKTLKVKKKYHILVRGTTGMNYTTSWKTSNKKVAKVSKTGYVTAKKKGTAKITCTVKVGSGSKQRTKKLTFKVTVKK